MLLLVRTMHLATPSVVVEEQETLLIPEENPGIWKV
jgi:hypothetical protein